MKKFTCVLTALLLILQVTTGAIGVSASAADVFVDTPAAVPNGNILPGSGFDDPSVLEKCDARNQKLEVIKGGDGSCLSMSGMTVNYQGFVYKLDTAIEKGNYKFTGYFKTADEGSLTFIRVNFRDSDAKTTHTIKIYPKSDKWLKVETYVTVTNDIADIWINGGNNGAYIQPYLVDNISLEKVSDIPSGGNVTSFGTPITPEEATASYTPPAMTVPSAPSAPSPDASEQPAVFVDVPSALPGGNILKNSDFDAPTALKHWKAGTQKIEHISDGGNGYLSMSGIMVNFAGFTYTPDVTVAAGKYKFTGYFKTQGEGVLTHLRLFFTDKSGTNTFFNVYPKGDKWIKVESYVSLADALKEIKVCGGTNGAFVQPYLVDNFSLEAVDSIPAGAAKSFGTPVTPEEATASNTVTAVEYKKYDAEAENFEVQGIIINQDETGFLKSSVGKDRSDVVNFVKQFEGTHVTDYMISVNNTTVAFPSETWTDYLDKYHQKTENGVSVDYSSDEKLKGAYHMFEELGVDYISVFAEEFPKIGINPWLSFRMNDVHDHGLETSSILSDYYHGHPEIRRVQYDTRTGGGFKYAQDYSYELVREHMLDLINEALDRYDVYGIELDYQRDIWLWRIGGEAEGIDILNAFMRDVKKLVATYEKKYGHDIKISVRVASDIETNFECGLDVVTWASEGIVDMVTPTGRYDTTDNDIPTAHWKSLLEPYGTVLAPGIDARVRNSATRKVSNNTLETMCGASANILSQGADKVYYFNYFRTFNSEQIEEDDRITTTDNTLPLSSAKGYFNMITTCGSLDKLMTVNRRIIPTYNDISPLWRNTNSQVPQSAMPGKAMNLHIPVGAIPDGAEVTLKFSISSDSAADEGKRPGVYVNSMPCTFEKAVYIAEYTDNLVLCYKVPAAACTDGYLTAQIIPTKDYLTIDHAEVYIAAPENAVAPENADKIPSSWAAPEVNTAVSADIVPSSLRYDYTDKITRQAFCTLIMTMLNKAEGTNDSYELLTKLGIEYTDSFTDTDSVDVVAANLMGIVNGRGNGIFDPLAGITRQEAAKMLASTAAVLGIKQGTAQNFADIGKAGSWAVDAINTTASIVSASGKNVMGGVGNGNFDPLGAYTREQSILTVYRLFDSIPKNARVTVVNKVDAVSKENAGRPSPAKNKPSGTQGIVLRAAAVELDVSKLAGTDVTDVILTLGSADASALIGKLQANGIKVYASVNADDGAAGVRAVLDRYSVDGIELDFLLADINQLAVSNSYGTFHKGTALLKEVNEVVAASGRDVKVSVRVASDVMTNYYIGLDISTWARMGLVDMVCPSSLSVSDTDMPVRLWHSMLADFDVSLAPVIGKAVDNKSGYGSFAHTKETISAEALYMLSSGADKVSVHYDTADAESLKLIGSYEKLLSVPSRMAVTYSDISVPWEKSDAQLPVNVGTGMAGVIRVPLGDTVSGADVKVRLAFRNYGITKEAMDGVAIYSNSVLCTANGAEAAVDPMTGYILYTYTVPAEALNMGQLVLEIMANNGAVNIIYVEAYVEQ